MAYPPARPKQTTPFGPGATPPTNGASSTGPTTGQSPPRTTGQTPGQAPAAPNAAGRGVAPTGIPVQPGNWDITHPATPPNMNPGGQNPLGNVWYGPMPGTPGGVPVGGGQYPGQGPANISGGKGGGTPVGGAPVATPGMPDGGGGKGGQGGGFSPTGAMPGPGRSISQPGRGLTGGAQMPPGMVGGGGGKGGGVGPSSQPFSEILTTQPGGGGGGDWASQPGTPYGPKPADTGNTGPGFAPDAQQNQDGWTRTGSGPWRPQTNDEMYGHTTNGGMNAGQGNTSQASLQQSLSDLLSGMNGASPSNQPQLYGTNVAYRGPAPGPNGGYQVPQGGNQGPANAGGGKGQDQYPLEQRRQLTR